jgi:hypothetical protein
LETRKQVLHTYIKSIILFGSETWNIHRQKNKNIKEYRDVVPPKSDEKTMDS